MMRFKMGDNLSSKLRIIKAIWPYLHQKKYIYGLFLLKAAALAVGLITPYFYKLMVDDVLIGGRFTLIWLVAAGYGMTYILETVILALEKYCENKTYHMMTLRVQSRIMDILSGLPQERLDSWDAGDLKNRITYGFEGFFYHNVIEYVYFIATALITAVILLFIDWKLALISFVTVPLSFLMTKFLAKKKLAASKALRAERVEYDGYIHTTLQNWKEVKLLGLENRQNERFDGYRTRISRLFMRNQVFWYLNRTFISIKDFFVTKMNLYFIGGLFIFSGGLTVGGLLVFMVYFDKMFKAIEGLNDLYMRYTDYRPPLEKMVEILEMQEDIKPRPVTLSAFKCLEFDNVSFSYAPGLPAVIKNMSFNINKGDILAFSGKSGCGKSTVIKLMLNLYGNFDGKILLNGTDINSISKTSIHSVIGAVMQDPYLMNLSIRENLLLADNKATDAELYDNLRQAAIYDFVASLPNGLDTVIGEKGIKLSGGQRQRLAIARVLLRDTDVVIFDEATSALDHESEKTVHQAIINISSEKTVIIISHRQSSLELAERVITM